MAMADERTPGYVFTDETLEGVKRKNESVSSFLMRIK